MTTRDKLKKMLVDCGLFDDQAEEIMKAAVIELDSATSEYKITWDKPAREYPEVLYQAIWPYLCKAALAWIGANMPQAWFRPMFENEAVKK